MIKTTLFFEQGFVKLNSGGITMKKLILFAAIMICSVNLAYAQNIGVNVALNKPATASASTDSEIPAYAFDADMNTNWCAPGNTGWLKVDLQDKYLVDSIKLYINQAITGNSVHEIKVSNDFENWTIVETLSGITSNGQILTVKFDEPLLNVRGVMINTPSSSAWVAWAEIEVYSIPTPSAETNLLTNAGAEKEYEGWTKVDGGNGWGINTVELGLTGIPHSGDKFWVSSYFNCTLSQTIDLLAAGFKESQLDASPNIKVGAFVAANSRTGSFATIKLELLDANDDVLSTHYVCNDLNILVNTPWTEKSLIVSNYGTGVRKLKYYLIGRDDRIWGGHFGTQFDDAFVYVGASISTGINDGTSKSISVSPNPASDFINLREYSGSIKIYDMKGSLMFSHNAAVNERIDISSLQNGVYVLRTTTENFKLIKK